MSVSPQNMHDLVVPNPTKKAVRKNASTKKVETTATAAMTTKTATLEPIDLIEPMEPRNDTDLADRYREMTDREHVLASTDTYMGSIALVSEQHWVLNDTLDAFDIRPVQYTPGLFKLGDEALVNCRDQAVRIQSEHAAELERIHATRESTGLSESTSTSTQTTPSTQAKEDARRLGAKYKPVTCIKVAVNTAESLITVHNDGNGIDVAVHPTSKVWIPEMIFARLRSGTNYDKSVDKIVGGRNGFGAKLVFIWSTWCKIETVDHIRGLKYEQEFRDNLNVIGEPKITKVKASTYPYTTISFRPDLARMGLETFSDDFIALIRRRAYDIAGTTDKRVTVWFNDVAIPVHTFTQYVEMYVPRNYDVEAKSTKEPCIHERASDRWEYSVCRSPFGEFRSVSFVNGICTPQGGKHVDYILSQITKKLVDVAMKKGHHVTASSIKEQLMLFVRSDIVNPSFNSQTKERLETPVAQFGSACVVSDAFIKKVVALGVLEVAGRLSDAKDLSKFKKKVDGAKTASVTGIPGFSDALYAGTSRSLETSLLLTEGDSARVGVLSGMSEDMLKLYGVLAARGKLLNVRKTKVNLRDTNNRTFREVIQICKIMGLEMGREYNTWEDVKKHLRYGNITFLSDQDLDGSHIKGLGINLIHAYWPSLCRLPGFIRYMNTPILTAMRPAGKSAKGKTRTEIVEFYNQQEYQLWEKEQLEQKSLGGKGNGGWTIRYYKGLGTSTPADFKRYMKNPRFVSFKYTGPASDQAIDLWFNDKRADDRKEWLTQKYDRSVYTDSVQSEVTYEDFFSKEMSHYSVYSNQRTLASVVDGLKPSLRKILYSAFKKGLTQEIKVSQFAGYVSEHSEYHHGEASLLAAIIGMAANYVTANNINLLWPCGQFGTQMHGVKDAAAARYIFTRLSKITRFLFRKEDDPVLKYLSEDGMSIEPETYIPILPMVLINGTDGVGTGWSTEVPPFHPLQLCNAVRQIIGTDSTDLPEFVPYYADFKGTIAPLKPGTFMTKGVYHMPDPSTVVITELPIGVWSETYVTQMIECDAAPPKDKEKDKDAANKAKEAKKKDTRILYDGQLLIRQIVPSNRPTDTHITVHLANPVTEALTAGSSLTTRSKLETLLGLGNTVSTTNMVLHDAHGQIQKYNTVEDIIRAFIPVRMQCYQQRKNHQLETMRSKLPIMRNKARFVREIKEGSLTIAGLSLDEASELLRSKRFDTDSQHPDDPYDYLLDLKMSSVFRENIQQLELQCQALEREIAVLEATTETQLWLKELDEFEEAYAQYLPLREESRAEVEDDDEPTATTTTTKKTVRRTAAKTTAAATTATAAKTKKAIASTSVA